MNIATKLATPTNEQFLIEQFGNLKTSLPGSTTIQRIRQTAFDSFKNQGLPHKRIESWHYTDLRTQLSEVWPIQIDETKTSQAITIPTCINSDKLVFVNGKFNFKLSALEEIKNFVNFKSLADTLSSDTDDITVLNYLKAPPPDILIDLNTAFMLEGSIIEIPENTKLEKPLELIHISTESDSSIYPRHFIRMAENSCATIIERYISQDESSNQTNSVVNSAIAESAKLDWIKILEGKPNSINIGSQTVEIGKNAKFDHFTFSEGNDLSRTQLFVKFNGENSTANLHGISLVKGTEHSDTTLQVNHAVPNCDSSEYYKSVIDERGHSVFQGKVVVEPDAQKTDGKMMVQSLLLSDDAAMSSKPELEIFADDVQCGHGSTTGQIDDELLFYLRARGIPEHEARSMLILAFLSEVIEQIEDSEMVDFLEDKTRSWLGTNKPSK